MQSWQKEYHNNFTRGMIISIAFRSIILLLIFVLSKTIVSDTSSEYYYVPYVSHPTLVNVGKVVPDGGGSFGNRIENINASASSENLIAGIPVLEKSSTSVEFAMKTHLTDKKNSSSVHDGNGLEVGEGNGVGKGTGNGKGYGFGGSLGSGFKQLPFMPRQILEVLPQKVEDAKGIIVLALKIGLDGTVKENKIILNTVNDSHCLKYVIEAAYKSKWEKIEMEGQQIKYWIEKTYRFN